MLMLGKYSRFFKPGKEIPLKPWEAPTPFSAPPQSNGGAIPASLNGAKIFRALDPLRKDETWPETSLLGVDEKQLLSTWAEFVSRLGSLPPFHRPDYAAHMQKPPHPVAISAYIAAMLAGPNNYTRESGEATLVMECEAVAELARMMGLPPSASGHLTSSGTIANLEALWMARELKPGGKVVLSDQAHHSHLEACRLLGLETIQIVSDRAGCIDLAALEKVLRRGKVGTVIVTAGTTGLGAVDPIHDVAKLRASYGFRLHADACYGGFYTLLSRGPGALLPAEPFAALADCDSIAIDPHKHGLQPLGCGCLLLREGLPSFSSSKQQPSYVDAASLAPGDPYRIECSRSGAAAAALWFTLKCFPLEPDCGLGPILAASLRAARRWAALLQTSSQLKLFVEPALDVVTYFPLAGACSTSKLDAYSHILVTAAREANDPPLYLSTLTVKSLHLSAQIPGLRVNEPYCRILRTVLMKPEHEGAVDDMYGRLAQLVKTRLQ
jgi:glutamate/tyrosine decarboxylase-like PLP-dependent enzyme